jgi:hypothetical protein
MRRDRLLAPDMAAAKRLVQTGALAEAVGADVLPLVDPAIDAAGP